MSYPYPPEGHDGQGWHNSGGHPPPQQGPGGYPPQPNTGGQPPQSGGYGPPPTAPGAHPGHGMPPPHQGQAWGDPYGQGMYGHGHPTHPECESAKVVHIGAIFGLLVALIMYLVKKDESPYVRYHATQALNFQLLMALGYFISWLLVFALIGVLMLPAVFITSLVIQIKAAGAAGRGEWYRFPFNVSWVR